MYCGRIVKTVVWSKSRIILIDNIFVEKFNSNDKGIQSTSSRERPQQQPIYPVSLAQLSQVNHIGTGAANIALIYLYCISHTAGHRSERERHLNGTCCSARAGGGGMRVV